MIFFEKKKEAFKIFEKFLIEDEETKRGWLSALDVDGGEEVYTNGAV